MSRLRVLQEAHAHALSAQKVDFMRKLKLQERQLKEATTALKMATRASEMDVHHLTTLVETERRALQEARANSATEVRAHRAEVEKLRSTLSVYESAVRSLKAVNPNGPKPNDPSPVLATFALTIIVLSPFILVLSNCA